MKSLFMVTLLFSNAVKAETPSRLFQAFGAANAICSAERSLDLATARAQAAADANCRSFGANTVVLARKVLGDQRGSCWANEPESAAVEIDYQCYFPDRSRE